MLNPGSSIAVLNDNVPSNRVALLMAGGDGTRLQEVTRKIGGIAPKSRRAVPNPRSLEFLSSGSCPDISAPDRAGGNGLGAAQHDRLQLLEPGEVCLSRVKRKSEV
jgi:hypothetical protein